MRFPHLSRFLVVTFLCSRLQSQETLRVDNDAANDPAPDDPLVSDPLEDGSEDHPFDDIQEALDAANDGATVLVMRGEYVIDRSLDFNRLHDPEEPSSPAVKNLTLRAMEGPVVTTVRMADHPVDADHASVVSFSKGEDPRTVIDGFTLTNGSGTRPPPDHIYTGSLVGGGVYCGYRTSPGIENCRIIGNVAFMGGGVYTDGSSRFVNCLIAGNFAAWLGGGFAGAEGPPPSLENCTISGNVAEEGAGVACFAWSGDVIFLAIDSCIVWGNAGKSAVAGEGESIRVRNSCLERVLWPGLGNIDSDPLFCGWDGLEEVVIDAAAPGPGDGSAESPFPRIREGLLYDYSLSALSPCIGTAAGGGNMGAMLGTCDISGSPRRMLRVRAGEYSVRGVTLAHGVSMTGSGRDTTVLRGTLFGLRTGGSLRGLSLTTGVLGGLILSPGEAPLVTDCRFSDETGNGFGVMCFDGSNPVLRDCDISACRGGGGLFCRDSSPCLINCRITGNSGHWGGIACWGSSPMLINCIVAGNRGREGGGLACSSSSPSLVNCTLSDNEAWSDGSARAGGGITCDSSSSPRLVNTIVWHNGMDPISLDSTSSLSVSHSDTEEASPLSGPGNTNVDPLFRMRGSWNDNGTPEREDDVWMDGEYDLLPGSQCRNAGTSAGAPVFDILHTGRNCLGGVDMGAFESGDCPVPVLFIRGDANANGQVDISDPIYILNYLFVGMQEPSCQAAADSNDSERVDLSDAVYTLNFLFGAGSRIPGPYPNCDIDPTPGLSCERFSPCSESDRACTRSALPFGASLAAFLESPERSHSYTVQARAGDRIRVRAFSHEIEPKISIVGEEGLPVEGGGHDGLGSVDYEVPGQGAASVVLFVSDAGHDATGTYDLSVERLNEPGAAQSVRFPVQFTYWRALHHGSAMGSHDLFVSAGMVLRARVESGTREPGRGLRRPSIELCDETGDVVAQASGEGIVSFDHRVDVGGRFFAFVSDAVGRGASRYHHAFQILNDAATAQTLSFGTSVERHASWLTTETFQFAEGGDKVQVLVEGGQGGRPRLELLSAEGDPLEDVTGVERVTLEYLAPEGPQERYFVCVTDACLPYGCTFRVALSRL